MEPVYVDNEDYAKELHDYLANGVKYSITGTQLQTKEYDFSFSPEFSDILSKYQQFDNPLIYGKSTQLGVVAIEHLKDSSQLELFYSNGTTRKFPYKPWMLFTEKVDTKCERLDGNLTYKYIRFLEPGEEKNFWRYKNKSYQIWNQREAAMALHGITLFKGLKPENLGVLSFDIEAAGLEHSQESEVYLITNVFTKNGVRTAKHFRADHYSSQAELLDDWCSWVREVNPDVLTAWNGLGYDLPYLQFVAHKNGTKILLGRDNSEIEFNNKSSEYRVDGSTSWTYKKISIYGRNFVDGMFLAVKHDIQRKYPSWSLKAIAEFEKLKKPDRTLYDASKIRENWSIPEEREKIVAYGIDDAEDSINLYELMIAPYFYTGQSIPKPFQDMMFGATGGWINSVMVRAYLQEGHSIPKASELGYLKGGISFGVPGIYRNVIKADLKSAYPSQVLRFKLYDKVKDPKAYFYTMVKYFAENRFYYKKMEKETGDKHWEYLNASAKVFINSAYGSLSTNGLNFNSPELARKITYETRQAIIQAVEWASGKPITHWFPEYTEDSA